MRFICREAYFLFLRSKKMARKFLFIFYFNYLGLASVFIAFFNYHFSAAVIFNKEKMISSNIYIYFFLFILIIYLFKINKEMFKYLIKVYEKEINLIKRFKIDIRYVALPIMYYALLVNIISLAISWITLFILKFFIKNTFIYFSYFRFSLLIFMLVIACLICLTAFYFMFFDKNISKE